MNLNRREFLGGLLGSVGAGAVVLKGVQPEPLTEEDIGKYDGYISLHGQRGHEPDDAAYSRQPVTFESIGDNRLANTNEIEFSSSEYWGLITHATLWGSVEEEILAVFYLASPKSIRKGESASFLPGSLEIILYE